LLKYREKYQSFLENIIENCEFEELIVLAKIELFDNASKVSVLFTGFITMGETRSPIFLKMIIANAQNTALSKEQNSPKYGIVVSMASITRLSFGRLDN
jgi:hypothetical protein